MRLLVMVCYPVLFQEEWDIFLDTPWYYRIFLVSTSFVASNLVHFHIENYRSEFINIAINRIV